MATAVIMPRQGQSVESCIISKWYKQKGDSVSIGDVLFSYETDKASFEEEAKTEGVILKIFFEEGDEVECLKTVCIVGAEGERVGPEEAQPGSPTPSGAVSAQDTGSQASSSELTIPRPELTIPGPELMVSESELTLPGPEHMVSGAEARAPGPESIRVSPRARALAEKTGADVRRAVPTGVNGRIMEKDIRKAIEDGYLLSRAARRSVSGASGISGIADVSAISGSGIGGRVTTADLMKQASQADGSPVSPQQVDSFSAPLPDFEDVPLTNIRKVIAKAMHASLADSAQLTNHSSFDATDVLNFRKNLKTIEGREDLAKITVTDIIVYAASRVLLKHRNLNAHFQSPKMRLWTNTHIGVAVDTPRGLLVPTIFNANKMTLTELSAHTKELIDKCKQKTITPDLLTGGSFTVSNLGGFGVEMFTPILNPPQTGLLGVCCVVERTRGGVPYPAMGLSLTYDHRVVDGADAARFLKDLISYLEKFTINLLLEDNYV